MCTADTAFACSLAAPPLLSQTFGRAAAVGWTRARQRRPRSRCSAAHVSLSPLRRDCCFGPGSSAYDSLPLLWHPPPLSLARGTPATSPTLVLASDLRPLSLRDAPLSTPPAHPVRRARLCALLGLSGGTPSAYDSVSLAVALSAPRPTRLSPPLSCGERAAPSLSARRSPPQRSRAAVFARCSPLLPALGPRSAPSLVAARRRPPPFVRSPSRGQR